MRSNEDKVSIAAGSRTGSFVSTVMNDEPTKFTLPFLTSMNDQLGTIASHMDRMTSAAQRPEARGTENIYADIRNMLKKKRQVSVQVGNV